MAKRKQRSELKKLFEELDGVLPLNLAKRSKWEILAHGM
jgi:hypothetical protein